MDNMTTSAAATARGVNAKNNGIYWAVFTRIPSHPIVSGSHYGTRVDCATECDGLHGHVWSSEAAARARLAILPTNYSKDGIAGAGAPIGREVGRVLFHSGGYFYDVEQRNAGNLRAGMRVNVGTIGGGDYWQTIARIWPKAAGKISTWYVSWEGAEDSAAPSIISDRGLYEVLRTEY